MQLKTWKHLPLLLLILFTALCNAQRVNIYWGKQNPVKRFETSSLLGRRGDVLWGYKQRRNGVSLLKYSFTDLQVKGEYPIIGESKNKSASLIDEDYSFNSFLLLKNKFYVIVSKYDKNTDLNTIHAQEIDENGKLTGSLKKLGDISAKSRRNRGSFLIFSSKDSSKVLLVNNPPYDKYAGEKFRFQVFDESMKQLSNAEVTMPYKDKNFNTENYILANDGIIYVLAKIKLEKKEKQREEAGYYYEVLSIDPSGKGEVIEYEVKLPKKEILDVSYDLEEGKGIICAGFYNNIEAKGISRDEINGIFYLRINKATKTIDASGTKELDKEFIAELTSKRKADKGRGLQSTFELKHFIKKKDGGAVLVAENAYSYATTVYTSTGAYGGGSSRTIWHYIRNNIIVININPDGSIKWYTNIPKDQHTTDDGGAYSSFLLAETVDKWYFIYNDNPKNMDPNKVKSSRDIKSMGNPKKSMAVLVELTEDGKYTKKALFSSKENKMILLPYSSTEISNNEHVATTLNAGLFCCIIPIKSPKSKLVRFEFK